MNFLKTSALNGIAVLVRMVTLLGINKVLAVTVGPSGYALIGQFQNAVHMISTFSSGAISTGVTKFTAEKANDPEFLARLWKTSGTISLVGTLLASILVITFSQDLSAYFLHDSNLGSVFVWFGVSLVFFVLNTLLLAVLNGKKEIRLYVGANISGSLLALIFTIALSHVYGLKGALIALGTYQSFAFIITICLVIKRPWFKKDLFLGRLDRDITLKLSHYGLMALTSAIVVPFSHILIRNFLSKSLSLQAAGEWEAVWRFSTAYLMFITSTLSVYFLPRLAELERKSEIQKEILHTLKLIVPALLVVTAGIFLFRNEIIRLLFSEQFEGIGSLFLFQLMGDVVKVVSWVFAFVMLTKSLTVEYVISEILFSFLFYFLIINLVPEHGLISTSVAHLVNYVCYLVFVVFSLKRKNLI